jgi:allophanate hydrolase subunit 2
MLPVTSLKPDYGVLRVLLGPQQDYFTDQGIAQFLAGEYRVTPESDRMGYRLEGPKVEHRGDYNIVSDGIAPGSVQIPGNGQPILLLADRQSTGGYPKIATVISADVPRLAQFRPGQSVRFEAVSVAQASALAVRAQETFHRHCAEIRPRPSMAHAFSSEWLLSLNLIGGVSAGNAADES